MRREFRAAMIAVVSCGLLAACAPGEVEGGPGDTIRTFYRHLNEGSYGAAKRLYDDSVRAMLDDPAASSEAGFRDWARRETRSGTVSDVKILDSSVEAASANVEYEIVYSDGTRERRTVTLTQQAEQWRLGFISAG